MKREFPFSPCKLEIVRHGNFSTEPHFPRRISNHPDLYFVVILNPHDGPGAADFPDTNYAREIPRLNAYANVCKVGYVRINYCKRAMAEVCRDIATYAGWAEDYARSGLAVQGIFFDETPNLYSASVATYLNTIDQIVKEMFGILRERLVSKSPQSHKGRNSFVFPSRF
jgi:hypothetical protein